MKKNDLESYISERSKKDPNLKDLINTAIKRKKLNKIKKIYLSTALLSTLVLNALDGMLTLFLVSMGAAKEVNPICNYLLSLGSAPFLLVKIGITSLLILWILYRIRKIDNFTWKYTVPITILFIFYTLLVVNNTIIFLIVL